jgi:hypothetical protein
MPEPMRDRKPENMTDRMPEDLPVTKRINVMLGMIRSKVFFWLFSGATWLTGPQKLKPEDAIKVLSLCMKAREDNRAMTEEMFKSQLCSPMLAKTAWVKSMRGMFGKMVETPAPCCCLGIAFMLSRCDVVSSVLD